MLRPKHLGHWLQLFLRPVRGALTLWNVNDGENITGWWCNNHLEKYESQWEGYYIIYEMENKQIWLVIYLPLWKIWVKVSWDDFPFPINMKSHKIPWFQSPPIALDLTKGLKVWKLNDSSQLGHLERSHSESTKKHLFEQRKLVGGARTIFFHG